VDDGALGVEPADRLVLCLGEREDEAGAVVVAVADRAGAAGAVRVDRPLGVHRLLRERHRVDPGRAPEDTPCLLPVEDEDEAALDALAVLFERFGVRDGVVAEIDVDVLDGVAGEKRLPVRVHTHARALRRINAPDSGDRRSQGF